MRSRSRREQRLHELEAELRARRSDPPRAFVQALAAQARSQPRRAGARWIRPSSRLVLVLGLIVVALVGVTSAGGFSSAVSSLTSVVHVFKHAAKPTSRRVVVTQSPASIQYGRRCGSPPNLKCTVRLMPAAVVVREPASGQVGVRFTAGLNYPSDGTVQVSFSTLDGTAKASDGDYAPASETLSFSAGQQQKTVTVYVLADHSPERTEYFFAKLSNPVHATILGTGSSRVTIIS